MEELNTIGFDETYVKLKLVGREFKVTADPPVDIYWNLINAVQNNKGGLKDINKLKSYIIDFILNSHYSRLSLFKHIKKPFDKIFLKNNVGFVSLNGFITQYFEIINKRGDLKNVVSPQK